MEPMWKITLIALICGLVHVAMACEELADRLMDLDHHLWNQGQANEIDDEPDLMVPMRSRGRIDEGWHRDADKTMVDDEGRAADTMFRFRFRMRNRRNRCRGRIGRRPIMVRNINELYGKPKSCHCGSIACRRFASGLVERCPMTPCHCCRRPRRRLCTPYNRCFMCGRSCCMCSTYIGVRTRDLCRDCHRFPVNISACRARRHCEPIVGRCL